MKFEYWKTFWRKWNYHLVSNNHKVLMQSTQGHANKQDMLNTIQKIKTSLGVDTPVVDIT